MANLPEAPQYDEGIYQIERLDPVVGGSEGVTNKPAKQLANRTNWLKQQIEFLQKELDGLSTDFWDLTNKPATATRWPSYTEVTNKPTIYPSDWNTLAHKPATSTRWPSFTEVTNKPTIYPSDWNTLAHKPATSTRWPSFTEVTNKPTTYPSDWNTLAHKPSYAARWPNWGEVTGKPTAYKPSSHRHNARDIDGLNTSISGSNAHGYYSKDPSSGIITQWGNRENADVRQGYFYFPISFSKVHSVFGIIGHATYQHGYALVLKYIRTSGFKYWSMDNYSAGAFIHWMAIGE